MKIKFLANELKDGNIEFVSLVAHGANRTPFKIVKADDQKGKTALDVLAETFTQLAEQITANSKKFEEIANVVDGKGKTPVEKQAEQKQAEDRALQIQTLKVRLRHLNDQWGLLLERGNDTVSKSLLGGLETDIARTELQLASLESDERQMNASSAFFRRGGSSVNSNATLFDSAYERPTLSKAAATIDLNSPLTMSDHEGIDFRGVSLDDKL